jgi:polyphenol oxidase
MDLSSWLHVNNWSSFPGLIHGFSGRLSDHSNVSAGPGMNGLALYTLKQVHGNDIVVVRQFDRLPEEKPLADGLITAKAGALLGIATADCVPVLLVEPHTRLVAALHAGWRGTLQGICARAVTMLKTDWAVQPQYLWAALGPAIGGCCYEVGNDVGETLHKRWQTDNPIAWRPYQGKDADNQKGLLDLRAINRAQLEQAGIPSPQVEAVGPCTFCDSDFASYRRDGADAGRQLSVIGWRVEG